MTTQSCRRCRRELPADADHFYRTADAKSGLRSVCRDCDKARAKRAYREHRERCLVTRRAYVAANAERVRDTNRRAWARHGDRYRAAKRTDEAAVARRDRERERAAVEDGKARFPLAFSVIRYATGFYRAAGVGTGASAPGERLRPGSVVVARFERSLSVEGEWVVLPPHGASEAARQRAAAVAERERRCRAARAGWETRQRAAAALLAGGTAA